jgi:hypothetical protein
VKRPPYPYETTEPWARAFAWGRSAQYYARRALRPLFGGSVGRRRPKDMDYVRYDIDQMMVELDLGLRALIAANPYIVGDG